jgi:uncharacterized protein with GYD domain
MKYLFTAEYNTSGAAGVIKDGGTARQAAIESLVNSVGGTLDVCYFGALGKDVTMIVDVPDQATVTAVLFTVAASGATEELAAAPLLTAQQLDDAMKKSPAYTPPGG